jgi:hypothetical protein
MAFRRSGDGIHDFMKHFLLFFSFLHILIFLSASTVFAQVQTRVRVIQASNTGSTIDPSLRDVHDQLGSLFSFTSYRLLKDETVSLSPNQPVSLPTHPGTALEIELIRKQKDVAEFKVRIKRERTEILNTQVRLSPGRTVVIGGPKHGDGTIILAITARF